GETTQRHGNDDAAASRNASLDIAYRDEEFNTAGPPGAPYRHGRLSPRPSVLALMLDLAEGDRVLHVGTGTGYTAAVPCQRLGVAEVTTVGTGGLASRLLAAKGARGSDSAADVGYPCHSCHRPSPASRELDALGTAYASDRGPAEASARATQPSGPVTW